MKAIAGVHRFYIGARAAKASRFAVLDIDNKSKYHNIEEFRRLREVLAEAGLAKIVPYQSSSSGGWHLYIFFDQPISSRDLHKQLTALMTLSNFKVQKGQLEVFPNPGESRVSAGHGLRLPLQPGWAWLNPASMELEILRDEISALEALDLFLIDLKQSANSQHDFHKLKRYVEDILARQENVLERRKDLEISEIAGKRGNVVAIRSTVAAASDEALQAVRKAFGALPPGIRAEFWCKGREYYEQGLTGPSQRAEAIFTLGHYLFYGDPENNLPALGYGCEQERQWLLEEIISTKHNGHSQDLNKGRADALAQIRRAARWRPAAKQDEEHRAYSVQVPISWVLENQKRKRDARARIRQANEDLKATGRVFSASELREKAGCSWTTLYKHEDLWKEELIQEEDQVSAYEQISEDLFAISTHDYNAVVGASASGCSSFSTSCLFFDLAQGGLVSSFPPVILPPKKLFETAVQRRSFVAVLCPSEFSRLSVSELSGSICFLGFWRDPASVQEGSWLHNWKMCSFNLHYSYDSRYLVNISTGDLTFIKSINLPQVVSNHVRKFLPKNFYTSFCFDFCPSWPSKL